MAFKDHLVFVPAPSWGHCRPALAISVKIVKEAPDILVTIPVIGKFKAKMDKEMARYCTGSNALKENIRIVQISDFNGAELQYWGLIHELWPAFFEKLWASEPISCLSGQTYPCAPRPRLCIVDAVLSFPLALSLIDEKKVKVLFWGPAGLATMVYFFGPSELGGFGNIEQDAKELAESKNITINEATVELFIRTRGEVKNVAGLPPAYDYEFAWEYNIPGAEELWVDLVKSTGKFFRECDGIIVASTSIVEEGATKAIGEWFNSKGKPFYALGPCNLPDEAVIDHEESSRGQEVSDFLDKIYERNGKHSILYMSFGTSIFPGGDTVWQLIDIILDMGIPLIFAMPHDDTFHTKLPADLRNRLESSEFALVAQWAPQQMILAHPATGVFLTHGGHGSVMESLVSGVPMIVWPLQADQPASSMNLTLNLKVAYQLLEVRIDHGLKPLYRGYQPKGTKEAIDTEFRQVLKDAFGQDGDIKRRIAQELSERLKATWKEGGEALSGLRQMLKDNFS